MWKPGDYCSDNLIYKGFVEWIATWKKNLIQVCGIIEKKILVNVPVQIPYSIESQVAGFRIQTTMIKFFNRKAVGFRL